MTLLQGIQQRVRAVGNQFDPLLAQAEPVDVGPVVAAIDARLRPGWQYSATLTPIEQELVSLRSRLVGRAGNEQVISAQNPHAIQSEIRLTIDDLVGANPSGADVRLANALRPIRQNIIDAIDESVSGPPAGAAGVAGPYRAILRSYADENSVRRAFDRGWQLFDNPRAGVRAYESRPEFWRAWADDLSPDELEAARLGARARLDTEINSTRNEAAPRRGHLGSRLQSRADGNSVRRGRGRLADTAARRRFANGPQQNRPDRRQSNSATDIRS